MSPAPSRPAGRAGQSRPAATARRPPPRTRTPRVPARPRLRLRTSIAAGVAGSAALALTWVIGFSSVLAARDVAVTGTSQLSAEEVLAAAHVPLGRPMARLDPAAIEQATQRLATVRTAHVYRHWPHTVEIAVEERVPVAVIPTSSADWAYVDSSGITFGLASAPRPGDRLPRLQAQPGTPAAASAAAVVTHLSSGLRARLDHVEARGPNAVVLHLSGGITVVWGDSSRAARKAAVVQALLLARPGRYYDVGSPDTPTLR